MPRVKYFSKVRRTQFNRLPNGAVYYDDSTGNGPNVKLGSRNKLASNSYPTSTAGTAIADVSAKVRRTGKRMLGQAIYR